MEKATSINLPRFFFPNAEVQPTAPCLHVFADASPKAYGTVSYITDGTQSSLVIAKSRDAPLKKLNLPPLELVAASTAARLAQFVSQALKSRYPHLKTRLWSDSEILLHWLGSSKPSKQLLFAASRSRETKNMYAIPFWSHCPTTDNPADLHIRGINTQQLQDSPHGNMVHGGFYQNPNGQYGTLRKFFTYSFLCPLKKHQLMLNLFQTTQTLAKLMSSIYQIQHTIHCNYQDTKVAFYSEIWQLQG